MRKFIDALLGKQKSRLRTISLFYYVRHRVYSLVCLWKKRNVLSKPIKGIVKR